VIVGKYSDHLPLYRLEKILGRCDIDIARSTMCAWIHAAAMLVKPLADLIANRVRRSKVIHTDETRIPVQECDEAGRCKNGRMWTYIGDEANPYIVYDYTPDRSRAGPTRWLDKYKGYLQADAYGGYDGIYAGGNIIEVACWAHARRKFFEAGDVPEAREALDIINLIYGVEHEAERREVQKTDGHLALRREFARPLFVRLLQLVRGVRRSHGPKTLLGRAARYTWNNQRQLARAFRDARIPLDNNRAENALRVIALGRKNFLFVHSEEAGKELALLYSLVVSCTRVGVNPVEYLADVLDRIDKTADYADLLPDRWARATDAVNSATFDE